MMDYLLVALALLGVLILAGVGLVVPRLRRRPEPPLPRTEVDTRAEEDLAGPPVEAPESDLSTGVLVEPPVIEAPAPTVEVPEPTAGRLVRLRSRLSRSQNAFGKGLLGLLSRDRLDEDVWEEIEDSLITADVGVDATREIVDRLRERTRVLGTRSVAELRTLLATELVNALDPALDRALHTTPKEGVPAVLLVVGVNGAGKTTTCGKIARVLIADGRTVLLGAADTFRAAAADQLETWAGRVGAETVPKQA
ncbi:signal recognition particle-docking protein FtsY, partial [Verrucosispora sp. SN26_14.1]|uniref:signal recognition particle receptor subunit alpha n=1 Tax=Verrucosispora sp. SN26_14.1 TaxID=2527879 RepID=UPI0010D4FF4B